MPCFAKPVLGGGDERRGGLGVERFEHAPIADALAHMLLHELVDLRADSADDLAVALGKPELGLGMLEPRVLAGRDEAVDLVLQRRDPVRIVLVNLPCEVDEGLAVLLRCDRADGDGGAFMGRRASALRGRAPVKVGTPNWRHYLLTNTRQS